jgi:hypothetical protein
MTIPAIAMFVDAGIGIPAYERCYLLLVPEVAGAAILAAGFGTTW